jgi:tetratricopeptide (TPR) repeat protein
MRILKNRIILSFVIIFAALYCWEFYVKPVSGPIYTAAVSEYKAQHYERSLELLKAAYRVNPNDTAVLTLMGWNYLKLHQGSVGEPYFERAYRFSPQVDDLLLGYVYTEIQLQKYERATALLTTLSRRAGDTAEVHMAWATLYREAGHTWDAAREYRLVLALQRNNAEAVESLQEIYNDKIDVDKLSLTFPPAVRPAELTYTARVQGDYFAWKSGDAWKLVYLKGVELSAVLPGHPQSDSTREAALYADWFSKIADLGVNTVRIPSILPPAFYRELLRYDSDRSHRPLRLLQGVAFDDPPHNDFFERRYYEACQKEIRTAIDVIHGEGDVAASALHGAGLYPLDVSSWTAGLVLGNTWLSHVVIANNVVHPNMQHYQGTYVEVPSGSPAEIFLAQMIDFAAEYEESKYNWQHPLAYLNWSGLDPIVHPTESTTQEQIWTRHGLGERFPIPREPYDDDDSVSVDPMHLRPTSRLAAGYFAAYDAFPTYPDFINRDPAYRKLRDAQGENPFLGYLKDLKAHHPGIPLLISAYGLPTSRGVGHFNSPGPNEGGDSEQQQGALLSRFSRSIYDAGAAGGIVFEWLDEWFRQSAVARDLEVPPNHKPLWYNSLDPAEHYGLLAVGPGGGPAQPTGGDADRWVGIPPLYSKPPQPLHAWGDRYDPARTLKALYARADEGFLHLRLEVSKLDNDGDGVPDWQQANYVIGIATEPGLAGLAYLPFIASPRFPMGMTYAIRLAGPQDGRIWVASSCNPYQIRAVDGIPNQTDCTPKLGWKPSVTESGVFEPPIREPNHRRFSRRGEYFPPRRQDLGMLLQGGLRPGAADYNPLAEWHADVAANTVDLRLPWGLLGVTDPPALRVFAGWDELGRALFTDTTGFMFVAFSYRPQEVLSSFPIMEQRHPVADSLPSLPGAPSMLAAALRQFRWQRWDSPQYSLRAKESYAILRKGLLELPELPPSRRPEAKRGLVGKIARRAPNARGEGVAR